MTIAATASVSVVRLALPPARNSSPVAKLRAMW